MKHIFEIHERNIDRAYPPAAIFSATRKLRNDTNGSSNFVTGSQAERLAYIANTRPLSGHEFHHLILACNDDSRISDDELSEIVRTFVENHCIAENSTAMNYRGDRYSDWAWLSLLFDKLPEIALWPLVEGAITTKADLRDDAVRKLNESMQGHLFLEDHVLNRRVRIEYARSPGNIVYMREAAGSKHVWMEEEVFSELVEVNDSRAFACFARCEHMKPHHLMYIEHKLEIDPHGHEFLGTSYDAKITLKKALELQGHARELAYMKLALMVLDIAAGEDGRKPEKRDPKLLWHTFLNLTKLDFAAAQDMLEAARQAKSAMAAA
jgi:hypothetical protein